MIRKIISQGNLFVGVLVLFCVLSVFRTFEGLEWKTMDFRFRQRPYELPEERIAVIGISGTCLSTIGKWPWPKKIHAQLLQILKKAGVSLVAFDVIFQEPSSDPKDDEAFLQAVKDFGKAIFALYIESFLTISQEDSTKKIVVQTVNYPFPALASAAAGLGFINMEFKEFNLDGIVRLTKLFDEANGKVYPSLSLAVIRFIRGETGKLEKKPLKVAGITIPEFERHNIFFSNGSAGKFDFAYFINFIGHEISGTFPTFYYSDVISGNIDPQFFKNKIVLVGALANGLTDIKLSAYGEIPGIFVHANVIQNLLNANFLLFCGPVISIANLLLLGFILWMLLTRVSSVKSFFGVVFLFFFYNWCAVYLFLKHKIVLEMVTPCGFIICQYVSGRLFQQFQGLILADQTIQAQGEEIEKTTEEMSMGWVVQEKLFPHGLLQRGEYKVCGLSKPSSYIGGDYFDYFKVGEAQVHVFIGDVTGHGIPAALVMAMTKALIVNSVESAFTLQKIVENLNIRILEIMKRKLLVTFCGISIDTQSHQIQILNCGHPVVMKCDINGRFSEVPYCAGYPLGCKINLTSEPVSMVIQPGERLFLHTDGLIESLPNVERESYGNLFRKYFENRHTLEIQEACKDIFEKHPAIISGVPRPDDFTIVIIERQKTS